MDNSRPQILSTISLNSSLTDKVTVHGIDIDVVPFIDAIPIISPVLMVTVADLSRHDATVVFTSSNAVSIVARISDAKNNWRIYCIGNATKHLVVKHFGVANVIGAADNAAALADLIIQDNNVENVLFFCGDKRRDELPKKLSEAGIEVQEIVVYKTIPTPQRLTKQYDGILFFSPSGVESFFSMNTISEDAVLFAIGHTTAATLEGIKNKVIISDVPGKEEMLNLVIDHYKKEKTTHE